MGQPTSGQRVIPAGAALVVLGGVFGTLARHALSVTIPAPAGLPLPTFLTNMAGAFLLGLLLESLVRAGADSGSRRSLRLLAGTGFLGAFTTYSALAVEATALFGAGQAPAAVAYLAATLLLGLLVSAGGVMAGAWLHRRRAQ